MLDQLVAFCGDRIAEADVLSVFGFTSEQTVAQFTDRILRGETAEALELLHSEADDGKDMMKLMSDLISYLRDLLVGKVKPEALAEDLNPDLEKSLKAQAAMIETDRLLELIDQFAAAEGRMKWAPNKRLHFEVAVIKAIQTLNQVTLNEVIENLAALRDGKSPAVAGIADPSSDASKPRPPAPPAPAAVTDPGYKAPAPRQETSRVAEKAVPAESKTAPPDVSRIDHEEVWRKTVERVRATRRLIAGWVEAGTALGFEGRFLTVGFPTEQKTVMESLSIPKTREYVEALLKEITGQEWKIKFVLKEGLPASVPAQAAAPKKAESAATFKDDPLIREALEIFKGEIRTVTD
jgi:DNA polymerase-3 subunit gamma/tau